VCGGGVVNADFSLFPQHQEGGERIENKTKE
jgi:hypothetical protein